MWFSLPNSGGRCFSGRRWPKSATPFARFVINILEAEICPDHVHMLLEIPPKVSVSSFIGYLKGKSSLMLYEKFPALQVKYKGREFWCRGYYVDTTGKNTAKIAAYIQNQLKEDKYGDQLTMFGKM